MSTGLRLIYRNPAKVLVETRCHLIPVVFTTQDICGGLVGLTYLLNVGKEHDSQLHESGFVRNLSLVPAVHVKLPCRYTWRAHSEIFGRCTRYR